MVQPRNLDSFNVFCYFLVSVTIARGILSADNGLNTPPANSSTNVTSVDDVINTLSANNETNTPSANDTNMSPADEAKPRKPCESECEILSNTTNSKPCESDCENVNNTTIEKPCESRINESENSKNKTNSKPCESVSECEEEAREYLKNTYEKLESCYCKKAMTGAWNYENDLTSEEAKAAASAAEMKKAEFQFKEWNETIRHWNYTSFQDEKLKRQLKFLNVVDMSILSPREYETFNEILADMSKVYGTAKICQGSTSEWISGSDEEDTGYSTKEHVCHAGVEKIFSSSKDASELAYAWKAWRDAAGKPIREMYKQYIDLRNKAARQNGFSDNSGLWLFNYECDDFKQKIAVAWENIKELYEKLYGYCRHKLRQYYRHEFKNDDDPIPAHILGNMWAQQWFIYDLVAPYPNVEAFNVTNSLVERFGPGGIDSVTGMYELANQFFIDLGLENMTVAYGDKAAIVHSNDREIVCHGSAWDFCDGKDFRIKLCTKVCMDDFIAIHHEMGHIQYYMQYSNLPSTFREGANEGFHEAIGDVIALSVQTPKHMQKKGFCNATANNDEQIINYLMKMALEKVTLLPFAYVVDFYRWKLFDGSIPKEKMTEGWLKIRCEVQGVIPPVNRTEEDFDAGSKYHVAADTTYIRYFFSFILQFQLHKALCIKAGQYEPNNPKLPLHNCDIDGSLEVGAVIKELLKSGASKNWQDVLEKATGNRELDTLPIKEYFKPLMTWLDKQQQKYGYSTKWRTDAWEKLYSPK